MENVNVTETSPVTVSAVLGRLLDNAVRNPRTTVSGALTSCIAVIPVLLEGHAIKGKAAMIAGVVLAIAKVLWAAFFQKDAGSVPATLPGSDKVVAVPSHETPDSPSATPVV